jgi:malonyl-CoA O-methyltransferase
MSVPAESIFFDLWSATYDRPGVQYSTYRPIHDAVLARLEGVAPSVILDLGCGTGHLTTRLRVEFPEATVVGADLSDGMLTRAARRVDDNVGADEEQAGDDQSDDAGAPADDAERPIAFVRADAQRLPLASGSVDVIVCTESFHWYRDQEAAVAEIGRVLHSGGRLVIASIATVTGVADDALRRATTAAGRPVRAIPKRRLRHLLEAGGFEVLHQGRIPRLGFVPWPLLTDARRK